MRCGRENTCKYFIVCKIELTGAGLAGFSHFETASNEDFVITPEEMMVEVFDGLVRREREVAGRGSA